MIFLPGQSTARDRRGPGIAAGHRRRYDGVALLAQSRRLPWHRVSGNSVTLPIVLRDEARVGCGRARDTLRLLSPPGTSDMNTYSWIVCGLAAFDVLLVALLLLVLRSYSFLNRKGRM